MTAALALEGIAKRFGSVQALRGADFTLRPGTLHALLGENGAGKSTLMHVAYGTLRPDAGTIRVQGAVRQFASPLDARAAGIGMVHQHPTSIPALTVAENVALAVGWPVHRPAELRSRVVALTERLGLPLVPDQLAGSLSIALKQRLEIVKALAGDARILLLDEPGAVLAPREAEELLTRVRAFCDAGGSAVLITHKRREALAHADDITVLRAGAVVLSAPAHSLDEAALGTAMIGRGTTEGVTPRAPVTGAPLVSLRDVTVLRGDGPVRPLEVPTLELRGGEIVTVAAIEGNGQHELLRVIAGLLPIGSGSLEVARPIAFVPEDRTTEALLLDRSLADNLVLGVGTPAPWRHRWTIDWPLARARTAELITRFNIRAGGPTVTAETLSGGNQQKLVLARALEREPQVLVLENPTRGLDFDATAFIHAQLRAAASAGAAVLVHSTDLDEVLALGHRVVVVTDGRVVPAGPGADRASVGDLMLGSGA